MEYHSQCESTNFSWFLTLDCITVNLIERKRNRSDILWDGLIKCSYMIVVLEDKNFGSTLLHTILTTFIFQCHNETRNLAALLCWGHIGSWMILIANAHSRIDFFNIDGARISIFTYLKAMLLTASLEVALVKVALYIPFENIHSFKNSKAV